MPTNPRMYRKKHPFSSKYSQKNATRELSAKQLCEKLGPGFITPLSEPTPTPIIYVRRRGIGKVRNKAAIRIQRKWRTTRHVHPVRTASFTMDNVDSHVLVVGSELLKF